jgi:hypothetical protein
LRLADTPPLLQGFILDALGAAPDLSFECVGIPLLEFSEGVLVEVAEEGEDLGVEVGGLELEGEEGAADGLEGEGLDDRPLLDRLHLLLRLQEEAQLGGARDCPVEGRDFEDLELVAFGELLLGGGEDCAILECVDEAFEFAADLWGEEDEGVLGAEEDDDLGVLGVEEAAAEELLPREAEEEPLEEEGGRGVLPAIQSRHQQEAVEGLSLDYSFQFLPAEEEVFGRVPRGLGSFSLGEVLQHLCGSVCV